MADTPISGLPPGNQNAASVMPGVQSGVTNKLNIGTLAYQAASAVAITGGSIAGITDLAVADGGTGSSTAAAARIALAALGNVVAQFFTADGTYTPTSGMVACLVIATGGGGGGGGADCANFSTGALALGGHGGGGATCIEMFTAAQIGASQAVDIGAGGTAGAATNGGNGGAGAATTLGSLFSAGGGAAGLGTGLVADGTQVTGVSGAGGTATNGLMNLPGSAGFLPGVITIGFGLTGTPGGLPGHSIWGGLSSASPLSSVVAANNSVAGVNGTTFGCGGTGGICAQVSANQTEAAGGAGAAGCMLILEWTT